MRIPFSFIKQRSKKPSLPKGGWHTECDGRIEKSLPLEGKVSCEATRMRWKRMTVAFELHLISLATLDSFSFCEKPLKSENIRIYQQYIKSAAAVDGAML